MKKKRRILSVLLIFICFLLGACAVDNGEDRETDTKSNSTSGSSTDTATDTTQEEIELLPITENGKSEFSVVHNLNNSEQLNLLKTFISDLQETTGVRLPLNTQGKAENTYEILVGNVTTRTQSKKAQEELPYTASSVKMIGNKIVVSAYRTEDLEKALKSLSSAIVHTSDGSCGIPKDYSFENDSLKLDTKIPKLTFEKQEIDRVYDCANDQYEVSGDKATPADFATYRSRLEADGYALHAENSIGESLFATYYKGDAMAHICYYPSIKTMKCVFGKLGYLPSTEAPAYESVVTPSISQLGRKGAYDSAPGMSYVVQLADGSYIIMDGGPKNSEDSADLLKFLKENAPNGQKPRITWMITHADPDHMNLANAFLSEYHSEVTVTMVCYNFPDFNSISISSKPESAPAAQQRVNTFESLIKRYYPKAEIFVFHAGQKLCLPGCEIEILYTHEDQYPNSTGYLNHTSSAWRITIGGKTVMILGDCEKTLCQQMADVYGADLKSDILQVSHHGLNGACLDLYKAIDPSVCLWPIDDTRFQEDKKCLGTYSDKYDFNKWLREDPARVHYSSTHTVTLTFPDLQVKE